jgi:zinc protease
MKYFSAVILSLAIIGCSSIPLVSSSNLKLKTYKETQLKNGLKVLLMKDESLPYVSYTLLVKSGATSDPKGRMGLSSMTASLLKRGTSKRNAEQLAASLDQMGAEFSASVSNDHTVAGASGMSFHQNALLKDFAEILTEPAFPNQEIEKVRSLILSGLKQSVDNPSGFVSSVFDSFLYGEAHAYGGRTSGRVQDVRAIRKKDIIKHYVSTYRPNNAHLAVVGNYSNDILEQLEAAFGGWEPRALENTDVPGFPEIKDLQIQLIHKADLQQSQIRFGSQGIDRKNPDFLALRVANTILGGAFASRLVDEIREKRGLTYSISSYFDARLQEGPFVVSTFTRHEKVKETIQETLNTIELFRSKGVTEQEVKDAKALLKGSFPRAVETPEALAQNLLILRFYGIPDSYLTNYITDVEDISAARVNKVIQKYFDSKNMKVLVFSSKPKVYDALTSLGPVTVKDYQDLL